MTETGLRAGSGKSKTFTLATYSVAGGQREGLRHPRGARRPVDSRAPLHHLRAGPRTCQSLQAPRIFSKYSTSTANFADVLSVTGWAAGMTVTHVLGCVSLIGDSVIYLVANGCRSLDLTPEFHRIVEVLLQTGAALRADVVPQLRPCRSKCSRDRLMPSRLLRVAPGLRGDWGGMDIVVQARSHGGNVSDFSSRGALTIDRRRASRWHREQLIGGKAIAPRK
jgi:hypothetical protein